MEKKTTNVSNDCLKNCKELIRKHVSNSSLNVSCDEIINALTEAIDIEKFKAWYDRNIDYFKTKQNIQPYFNKAFQKELEKGTFEIKEPNTNPLTLVEALRNKGIIITPRDVLYIDIMWKVYLKRGMKIEDVQKLNNQIVNYMQKGEAFEDYISYVKRSKTTKPYNLDWGELQKEYDREITIWEELISLKEDNKDFEFEDDDWTNDLEETIRIAKTKIWDDEEGEDNG